MLSLLFSLKVAESGLDGTASASWALGPVIFIAGSLALFTRLLEPMATRRNFDGLAGRHETIYGG